MVDWAAGGGECSSYWGDREAYRRWPRPTPWIPALRRRAPTVRFITFETLVTGVRAFECAFSVRTSSFVHGLMTRRAVVAFTVLADFVVLTAFFKALGIIQVLHLNAAQIGTRCGDNKTGALTYSILKGQVCDSAAAGRRGNPSRHPQRACERCGVSISALLGPRTPRARRNTIGLTGDEPFDLRKRSDGPPRR